MTTDIPRMAFFFFSGVARRRRRKPRVPANSATEMPTPTASPKTTSPTAETVGKLEEWPPIWGLRAK